MIVPLKKFTHEIFIEHPYFQDTVPASEGRGTGQDPPLELIY